jgi:hypothetical protein
MIQNDQTYFQIRKKLHSLRQYEKRVALFSGFLKVFAVFCGTALLLLLLESLLWLKPAWKISALTLACVIGAATLAGSAGASLFSLIFLENHPNDETLAEKAGLAFPKIKDRLVNAIQVYRSREKEVERTSSFLAGAALDRIRFDIEPLDFRGVVSRRKIQGSFRAAVLTCVLVLFCATFFYHPMMEAWSRLCHPGKTFIKPIPYSIRFRPGSIRVVQGDSVMISAEGTGNMPKEIILTLKDKNDEKKILLNHPYFYRVASIQNRLEYRFFFEKYRSEKFVIEVLERPEIRILQAEIHPPPYTRKGIQKLESNVGHIDALKTSIVEISLKTNKEISKARLVFKSGFSVVLKADVKKAYGRFTVFQDDQYWVELSDKSGISNLNPIPFTVHVIPDLYPTANILSPDPTSEVDESMSVPLVLEAEDDYGVTDGRIGYVVSNTPSIHSATPDTAYFSVPFPARNSVHVLLTQFWDLKPLDLFPEDVVNYFFEVRDNDAVSGPKRGRSGMHAVRFPSIGEMLQKIESEQNRQIGALDSIAKDNNKFKQELDRLSDDLKKEPSLPWERKKELQNRLEEQISNQQEIQDLASKFNELLEQTKADDTIRRETLEKYQELQQLYREIASPEMADAMKKFQEALSQINPEMLKKAAEQYQMSQEDFLKVIERTLSLLKRVQIEQKIDEMIERMGKMAELQQNIDRTLQEKSNFNLKKSVHQEDQLQQEAESLEQDAETLSQKMEDLQGLPQSQFKAFQKSLESQDLPGRLNRVSDMIQNSQVEDAALRGEEAAQSMTELQKMLERVQNQLRNNQKDKVMASLKRTSAQLLGLSQDQETVTGDFQDGRLSNTQAAGKQRALESALQQVADSLFKLSQETFSVSPEMGRSMGEAKERMEQSIEMLRSGNKQNAAQLQNQSMGALNRTVLEVQNAMEKLAGSQSGLGMEEFFLQMEQMGNSQAALNQKIMDMLQQGRLSLGEQAAMTRLAAEQEAIKKRLEELLGRVNPNSRIPGNLDQLAKEMEKTIQELKQGSTRRETIDRQEHILSRLLDSQRSLREQDYGQKRKAKTGQNVARRSPNPFSGKTSPNEDRLRKSMLEASEDGYTPDFQVWIRDYFERMILEQGKK